MKDRISQSIHNLSFGEKTIMVNFTQINKNPIELVFREVGTDNWLDESILINIDFDDKSTFEKLNKKYGKNGYFLFDIVGIKSESLHSLFLKWSYDDVLKGIYLIYEFDEDVIVAAIGLLEYKTQKIGHEIDYSVDIIKETIIDCYSGRYTTLESWAEEFLSGMIPEGLVEYFDYARFAEVAKYQMNVLYVVNSTDDNEVLVFFVSSTFKNYERDLIFGKKDSKNPMLLSNKSVKYILNLLIEDWVDDSDYDPFNSYKNTKRKQWKVLVDLGCYCHEYNREQLDYLLRDRLCDTDKPSTVDMLSVDIYDFFDAIHQYTLISNNSLKYIIELVFDEWRNETVELYGTEATHDRSWDVLVDIGRYCKNNNIKEMNDFLRDKFVECGISTNLIDRAIYA